jgi:hypothetical protein
MSVELPPEGLIFSRKIPPGMKIKKFPRRGISSRNFGLAEQRPSDGRKGRQHNEERKNTYTRRLLDGGADAAAIIGRFFGEHRVQGCFRGQQLLPYQVPSDCRTNVG